jgi:two-component system CheB/CheR fusion protein
LGEGQWNIPALRKLLGTLLSKNTNFENFEVTHTFPGLGEKIMLLNASRIIQKTHREKLILLAIEDITERTRYHRKEKELLNDSIMVQETANEELEKAVKRRTSQLNEKNDELEAANKGLTSFTYISSHDLQEPLRKIQNFIGLIQGDKNKNLTKDSVLYLQRTADTATRMRSLIDALLAYTRTTKGEKHFEKKDLTILLQEVRHNLQEEIGEKKAVILADNLGELNVIPFQISQLFDILICNSLKFSKRGVAPRIVIKRKTVPGSAVKKLKLSSKETYCHIRYTDNGIGFAPQYNERIFEVFQRLHAHEDYKGKGIGLAICRRVVENHLGMITAIGKENKGVTFDIYIPVG